MAMNEYNIDANRCNKGFLGPSESSLVSADRNIKIINTSHRVTNCHVQDESLTLLSWQSMPLHHVMLQ